jgi:PHP family Zn ribbon phosphoesterase
MSGGSWDYVCYKFYDVAERLQRSQCSYRRALGKQVQTIGVAMKAIEWVDSSDCSPPHDTDAIKKALGQNGEKLVLEQLVEDAREIHQRLGEQIERAR